MVWWWVVGEERERSGGGTGGSARGGEKIREREKEAQRVEGNWSEVEGRVVEKDVQEEER